jgi:hypothetical protein
MPESRAAGLWWLRGPASAEAVERARWRLNRLRCMTPVEIGHRALRALAMRMERWALPAAGAVPAADISRASRPWLCLPFKWQPGSAASRAEEAACLAAAADIAAGRFDVFALKGVTLGSPPAWNRDPRTGREAPLTYGKLLDYRDPGLVGDIKYLWEPNRHLHLVTLAQACALTRDARHFQVLREHLESWFDACPYPRGANWSSALEAGIRLIHWSAAWQLLGGARSRFFDDAAGARLRSRWLASVYQHARFVEGFLSLHSSANNHLVGEAAGLFVAAVTWPCWGRSATWLAKARSLLEREALLQNATDGVNLEQALSYQQFELDLLLLPLLAGRANGVEFSAAYTTRVEAMIEYLASVMDAGGNVPAIGDSDDAMLVRLDHRPSFCRYRSTLATGALLFRRGDFKAKAGELDERTRWLFGPGTDAAYARLHDAGAQLPVRREFPVGGYYVLGCDFETADEIRLVADAGPLGYGSIAAHGHADALAFTLSVAGLELLVDPGTYAYHTEGPWRKYFRGTSAHNTVTVDGQDQSAPGGNFMWLRKARAQATEWQSSPGLDVFEGWHDGYRSLPDPVVHRRRITLDKRNRRIVIEDRLEMAGEHDIALHFHCHEECRVEPVEGGWSVARGARRLVLQLPRWTGASSRVHVGSVAPIAGWVSRRFDEKQPAPTIAWRARISGSAVLRTEIAC